MVRGDGVSARTTGDAQLNARTTAIVLPLHERGQPNASETSAWVRCRTSPEARWNVRRYEASALGKASLATRLTRRAIAAQGARMARLTKLIRISFSFVIGELLVLAVVAAWGAARLFDWLRCAVRKTARLRSSGPR
jgi:hypothetical protein